MDRQQDFDQFILETPIRYDSVRVDFVDGSFKIGLFENLNGDFDYLRRQNQWRFIENDKSVAYRENENDSKYTIVINGKDVDKLTIL